jgi:hypothetical protein
MVTTGGEPTGGTSPVPNGIGASLSSGGNLMVINGGKVPQAGTGATGGVAAHGGLLLQQ